MSKTKEHEQIVAEYVTCNFQGVWATQEASGHAYRRQKLVVSSWFKHLKHFQHIFIVRSDKFFCCVDARLRPISFIRKINPRIQGRTKFSRKKHRHIGHVL